MLQQVTLEDTTSIAIGAGILGTGGGGSTYLNRLRLEIELRKQGRAVPIVRADDVPDDALVCAVGGMARQPSAMKSCKKGRRSNGLYTPWKITFERRSTPSSSAKLAGATPWDR